MPGEIVWASDLGQTFVVEVIGALRRLVPTVPVANQTARWDFSGLVNAGQPPPPAAPWQVYVVDQGGMLHGGYHQAAGTVVSKGQLLVLDGSNHWSLASSPWQSEPFLRSGNGVSPMPDGAIEAIDAGVL